MVNKLFNKVKCVFYFYLKTKETGFPGGSVVKNLPANTGDMGSIPDPGRFHMLWSNYDPASQLLSLHSRACEQELLKPMHLRAMCFTTGDATR